MNIKKFNIGFILFSSVVLLISCLGEGNNVVEYGSQPAVTALEMNGENESVFFYIQDDIKIIPKTSPGNFGTGECVLLNYKVDLDDYQGEGNQFYEVELTGSPTVLKQWDLLTTTIDTTGVLDYERLIPTFEKRNAYIKDNLFLYFEYSISDSLTIHNDYKMYYFPDQTPKYDTIPNADVYEMFLRVETDTTKTPSRTSDTKMKDVNAFAIRQFVNQYRATELAKNQDHLYFRVKYARSFNSDSTSINWGESENIAIPLK
ncbi:MAG: hypothetical protein LUH15_10980 [Tannerellaceae bacterium]|nr:hypothetical protein [Tannerellaceae bacterium]